MFVHFIISQKNKTHVTTASLPCVSFKPSCFQTHVTVAIIRLHDRTRLLNGIRLNATFPAYLSFCCFRVETIFCKHLRSLSPSHFSPPQPPSLPSAVHIAGSCGCRCGMEAKDGDSFLCCQRALPHPVLCLPSHDPPATSCALGCQRQKQTSASFTANVA